MHIKTEQTGVGSQSEHMAARRLLKGTSADGRYEIIQNGLEGFLDKRGRTKNREYQGGISVQDMGASMKTIRDIAGSYSTRIQDLYYNNSNATNDLMAKSSDKIQDIANQARQEQAKQVKQSDKQVKQDSKQAKQDSKQAKQDNNKQASNKRKRGGLSDKEKGGNGYTETGEHNSARQQVVQDQLLEEPEEGLTTFRVSAKKRDDEDPLELFEGDTIVLQSNGRKSVLEIDSVTYGQEALVNERTRGLGRSRKGDGTEGSGVQQWRRSRALFTAYVTAKVSEET